jgi:hypothetical protein
VNSELIESVARAMDPLAWVEYGDRNHREITLIHARKAIPAVIEALAEEASGGPEALDMYDPGVFNAGSFIADWLRSHLADDHEPDVEGYTFLGRGRMHDNMPVYQKDSDSSLWIKTEGEMIPYSMTFDYTHGLGRVKG